MKKNISLEFTRHVVGSEVGLKMRQGGVDYLIFYGSVFSGHLNYNLHLKFH